MSDKKLILVVDDESHILHVVCLKLKNAGYETITASDGEEGYNLAMEHRPDLIITDYQMPFMSGLEMCGKLCSDLGDEKIPAIMLTARGFSLSDDDIARVNILEVMSKPFSPREVLSLTKNILDADENTKEAA